MSDTDHAELRRLFDLAIAAPSAERAARLEAAGADEALRRRVLAMVAAAEDEDDRFLAAPTDGAATEVAASPERAGATIGRYRLLQPIGEGGFGVVWMAEQREPITRTVALKIIKLGMDTKQVIGRFEAERQALAMMDHPNIAKVLDAGATDAGRPYFVMELVRGEPITSYCDRHQLPVAARLALFRDVCHAVQHAHQKGVIHRDLKPSNVMVTLHDGRPVPKVIDFGIAKATNARLTERTVFTEYRQLIGTPEYMSPEQAEMSGLDIDTRSDVYSLGVLLYELLTGTTPFDARQLRSAAHGEIQRIIREEMPHKPSTRLSTLETLPAIAAHRHTEPRKLGLLIRGDLDWIVMKALEKDRTRRYETANGLAEDVRRHLDGEPVSAGPPSAGYRLRKLVRRHRGAFAAAAAVFVVLVAGVIVSTLAMTWALREEARVTEQADRAEAALREVTGDFAARILADAEGPTPVPIVAAGEGGEVEALAVTAVNLVRFLDASRTEARRELARANAVTGLLDGMFTAADPHDLKGPDYTVRALLDEFGRTIDDQFHEQPLVEASIRSTVGNAYLNLGLAGDADAHLRRAAELLADEHGADDPRAGRAALRLAWVDHHRGDYAGAEGRARAVLARLDADDDSTDAARLRCSAMVTRAHMLHHLGRGFESEPILRDAVATARGAFGDEDETTLVAMYNLGAVCRDVGRLDEAATLYETIVGARRRLDGAEHPSTLTAMHNLALVYEFLRRSDDALALFEETLAARSRVLGASHPDTLRTMSSVASLESERGHHDRAIALAEQVREGMESALGPRHEDTLRAMAACAIAYSDAGRLDDAIELDRRTADLQAEVLGAGDWRTLGTLTNLGHALLRAGRPEEALATFEHCVPSMRRSLTPVHPWTRRAMRGQVEALTALGRGDEALSIERELLELQVAPAERPDAPTDVRNNAAWTLLVHDRAALRDPARALALAERACEDEEAADGDRLWMYLDTLALAQHETGDTAAAVATQRRAVALMPEGADPTMLERLATFEAALDAEGGGADDGS